MAFTPTAALVELRLMAGILKLPALQLQLATGEILLACAKIAKAFTKNVRGNSLSFHIWLFFFTKYNKKFTAIEFFKLWRRELVVFQIFIETRF